MQLFIACILVLSVSVEGKRGEVAKHGPNEVTENDAASLEHVECADTQPPADHVPVSSDDDAATEHRAVSLAHLAETATTQPPAEVCCCRSDRYCTHRETGSAGIIAAYHSDIKQCCRWETTAQDMMGHLSNALNSMMSDGPKEQDYCAKAGKNGVINGQKHVVSDDGLCSGGTRSDAALHLNSGITECSNCWRAMVQAQANGQSEYNEISCKSCCEYSPSFNPSGTQNAAKYGCGCTQLMGVFCDDQHVDEGTQRTMVVGKTQDNFMRHTSCSDCHYE